MMNSLVFDWKQNAVITKIEDDLFLNKQVEVAVLREDLLHPFVSGNKIRKLKYFYQELIDKDKEGCLSFGGPFSNHLHALSYFGKLFAIPTLGFVRGEYSEMLNNPTIADLIENKMEIHFLSRSEYRNKSDKNFIETLENKFPNFLQIPEGANHPLGFLGCKEILYDTCNDYNFVALSMGTGVTTAGILESLTENQKCIAVTSLKKYQQQLKDISNYSKNIEKLQVFFSSDKTEFGNFSRALISFINSFYSKFNILLDPIYNGKLFYTIFDLIEKDFFTKGSKILIIHTGGLQGIGGVNQMILKRKWKEKIVC